MSDTYTVLAPYYKAAGFAAESEVLRERLFNKIQSEGWLGLHVMELGSGIGETSAWFAEHGFRITAVDQSTAMMTESKRLAQEKGLSINWLQMDMRQIDATDNCDLILSLNTLNELRSIRDLEIVFAAANRALRMDKMLLFDLVTIQGLAELWGNRDYVLYDDPERLTVTARSRFSYETSANTRAYILHHWTGTQWDRLDETHILRGFSLQAVATLLQRTGFRIETVLDPHFDAFDPYRDTTGRAITIAIKERSVG